QVRQTGVAHPRTILIKPPQQELGQVGQAVEVLKVSIYDFLVAREVHRHQLAVPGWQIGGCPDVPLLARLVDGDRAPDGQNPLGGAAVEVLVAALRQSRFKRGRFGYDFDHHRVAAPQRDAVVLHFKTVGVRAFEDYLDFTGIDGRGVVALLQSQLFHRLVVALDRDLHARVGGFDDKFSFIGSHANDDAAFEQACGSDQG